MYIYAGVRPRFENRYKGRDEWNRNYILKVASGGKTSVNRVISESAKEIRFVLIQHRILLERKALLKFSVED